MKTLKTVLLLTISGAFTLGIFGFSSKYSAFDFRSLEKSMISVKKGLYASQFEVTNGQFIDFLNDLKASGKNDLYQQYYPDTTQWTKRFSASFLKPMEKNYFHHPAYREYPVVNISQQAVNAFCHWLTDQYYRKSKKKFANAVFRLPSREEWLKAAAPLPDHGLPWYGNFAYDESGQYMANIKQIDFSDPGKTTYAADGGFYTIASNSEAYPPNVNGLYNVIGNVAEMTNRKGSATGGHWDNYLAECYLDKTQEFDGPDPRVGFRVFMQVR